MLFALVTCLIAAALVAPQEPTRDVDLLSRPSADSAPTRVEISFFMLDLTTVDGASQSFAADVVMRADWHDPRLVAISEKVVMLPMSEIWNPRLELLNRRSGEITLPEELRVFPDGTVSYVQRFIGTFSAAMDLREFPLDKQVFKVNVVSATAGDSRNVELVADPDTDLTGRRDEFSVSDWWIGPIRIEPAPLLLSPDGEALSGIAMLVDGDRRLRYYVVQVVLPLMMIVTMAWTVFWVDPSVVATRMSVVVTTMLTVIAYRFALSGLVPRLSYLTRLDWFTLGSTSLILATLLTMAATAHLHARGRLELVETIDRRGRLWFAVAAVIIWTLPWIG